jgi:hypothetical protein
LEGDEAMSRRPTTPWFVLAGASLAVASCSSSSTPAPYNPDRPEAATGTPCADHITCGSGWCTDVGDRSVCTARCAAQSDCLAGWNCEVAPDQELSICQCSASQEVCDLKDNDCNGIVDDGPFPDETCAAQNGPGFACKDGRCQCRTMCGSHCTDPSTDALNCGGCGKACPPSTVCEKGTCACPAGRGACGGSCLDFTADHDNCGKCGNQCPNGAVCAGGACTCALGQTACSTSCADLSSDPVNCGACGNACSSSLMACVNAYCVGTLLGQQTVGSIAVQGNYVYWLTINMLSRVPIGGGPSEPVYQDPGGNGNDGSDCLAVDKDNAYYTNFYGGVVKVPLSGGTPTLLAPTGNQPYTRSIAIDATNAYWAVQIPGAIYSVPIAGGATTTLASGLNSPDGIAVGGGYVYYTERQYGPEAVTPHTLKRVPTSGGTITQVSSLTNIGECLALDANNVYATTYELPSALVGIVQIPLGGGAPVTLVTGLPAPVNRLAVTSTELYWTDGGGNFVGKVPLVGGPAAFVASGQIDPESIAVDSTNVYWGTYGPYGYGTISFGK